MIRARNSGVDFDIVATFEAAPGTSFPVTPVSMATRPDPATRTYPISLALPDDMARVVLPDIGHNGLLTEAAAHRAILHALQG